MPGPGRPFVRGVSGNPTGRRAAQPAYDLVKQCRAATPELVQRLVALTAHKDARVALAATQYVLDRAWGRPRQSLDVEGGPPVILASVLEDARTLFEDRMRRLVAAAGDGQRGQSESTVTDNGRPDGGDPGRAVAFETPAQQMRRELLGDLNDERPRA
jgi:hypothetical protein